MARNYYCLIAGLPDLLLGDKKLLYSSVALRETLEESLHTDDFELLKLFFLEFDHQNLLNLIFNQTPDFDGRGNFEKSDLEQLIDKKEIDFIESSTMPDYFLSFARQYHELGDDFNRINGEVFLSQGFLNHIKKFKNAFLQKYFAFDGLSKNVLLALNGRKFELEYENQLIGKDDWVEALKKNRARDFGLSNDYDQVEPLLQIFEEPNLLERELKLDRLKWNFIEEETFFNYFSIEKVMAFVIKLFMVERWLSLSAETGKEMFETLLHELENSYVFPEEYLLNHGKKK